MSSGGCFPQLIVLMCNTAAVIGLVSLFTGISTFVDYLLPNLSYRVSQNRCNPLIWQFISHQVIFHLSLKNPSHLFRKVKPDDKGRNWLTLFYSARERPSSWQHLRRDFFGLLPTESLTASTLSGHLAINFLSDLEFSAFLLRLFTDPVTWNFCTQRIIDKLNFPQNFACTVLNGFVSKSVDCMIIFTNPLRSGRIWHKVSFLSGV